MQGQIFLYILPIQSVMLGFLSLLTIIKARNPKARYHYKESPNPEPDRTIYIIS